MAKVFVSLIMLKITLSLLIFASACAQALDCGLVTSNCGLCHTSCGFTGCNSQKDDCSVQLAAAGEGCDATLESCYADCGSTLCLAGCSDTWLGCVCSADIAAASCFNDVTCEMKGSDLCASDDGDPNPTAPSTTPIPNASDTTTTPPTASQTGTPPAPPPTKPDPCTGYFLSTFSNTCDYLNYASLAAGVFCPLSITNLEGIVASVVGELGNIVSEYLDGSQSNSDSVTFSRAEAFYQALSSASLKLGAEAIENSVAFATLPEVYVAACDLAGATALASTACGGFLSAYKSAHQCPQRRSSITLNSRQTVRERKVETHSRLKERQSVLSSGNPCTDFLAIIPPDVCKADLAQACAFISSPDNAADLASTGTDLSPIRQLCQSSLPLQLSTLCSLKEALQVFQPYCTLAQAEASSPAPTIAISKARTRRAAAQLFKDHRVAW